MNNNVFIRVQSHTIQITNSKGQKRKRKECKKKLTMKGEMHKKMF